MLFLYFYDRILGKGLLDCWQGFWLEENELQKGGREIKKCALKFSVRVIRFFFNKLDNLKINFKIILWRIMFLQR